MKFIFKLLLLSLVFCTSATAFAQAVPSTYNLYVSPSGSDSNDCLTALTACQHPNAALARLNSTVTGPVNVNLDVGNYYAAPYASDGGAPSVMDGKATIDLEGLNVQPNGSVNVICSTQQINPAGLVAGAVDAGSLSVGGKSYEGWVQIAIDGGWGDYAVDAGYAYLDGGVGVLNTNSLVGKFIQFTVGAGLITAPIVSNDSRVINYVTSGNYATQAGPVAPNASSKYNLFAPASHVYPYPIDGGASSAYAYTDVYIGGNTGLTAMDSYPADNVVSLPASNGRVNLYYCDIAAAPTGSLSSFYTAINSGAGLAGINSSDVEAPDATTEAIFNSGALGVNNSYVKTGSSAFAGIDAEYGAKTWIVGDLLSGTANNVFTNGSLVSMASSVVMNASTVGAPAINANHASSVYLTGVYVDVGNSQNTIVGVSSRSRLYPNSAQLVTDGGVGAVTCGSGGEIATAGNIAIADAGENFLSVDNGVTWITQTAYSVQDGGSAGVHAYSDPGSGCLYTSY